MPLEIFHSPEEWASKAAGGARSVLSVGNFDGLHLGHQRILQRVVERARADRNLSGIVTFDPHPLHILRPGQAPPLIETLAQRLAGFSNAGIDAALVLRFDAALSRVSAEDFIRTILVEKLRVAAILVGENFRFGHHGAGNVELLSAAGRQRGFDVEIVPPAQIGGQIVSSTAIRRAIADGNVADATPMLGRAFSLTGEIRGGAGRGQKILFPTLNLAPEQELRPGLGVYATESVLDGRVYGSVTNVGTRPTFDGRDVTVESHLFDFSEQVVQGRLEVCFRRRLRDEKKFSGPDELRAQIARDIAAAKDYFRQFSQ